VFTLLLTNLLIKFSLSYQYNYGIFFKLVSVIQINNTQNKQRLVTLFNIEIKKFIFTINTNLVNKGG